MYDFVSQSTETQDPHCNTSVSTFKSDGTSPREMIEPVRKKARSDNVPTSVRWVRRILAILILLCLAMAAWVWAGILHGL